MSARRHPTVFPGFKEMAERRHSVSGQLTSLRRELGLSQAEVAARMGTSQSAVARFEAGDLDVRLSTVERYTSALGARLEWRIEHGRGMRHETDETDELATTTGLGCRHRGARGAAASIGGPNTCPTCWRAGSSNSASCC